MNWKLSLLLCSALVVAGCSSKGGSDPGTPDPGIPGTPNPGTPDPGTPDPGTPDPGTPDPGTPDPGPATVAEYCAAITETYASKFAACSPYTEDVLRFEMEFYGFSCPLLAEAEAAGRLAYDRAKANACLSAFAAMSCFDLEHSEELLSSDCIAGFGGQVPPDGTCALVGHAIECEAGAYCEADACSVEAPGRCVVYGQENEACGDSVNYRLCGEGLGCSSSDICLPLVTVPFASEGEECAGRHCQDGLYCGDVEGVSRCLPKVAVEGQCATWDACARGASCVDGVCVAWKRAGAVCTVGEDQCVTGTYCDAATSTCRPWPTAGATCGTPEGGEQRDCIDSWCKVEPAAPEAGTCMPYVALDAQCDPAQEWTQCGPFALCVDGTCQRTYCSFL